MFFFQKEILWGLMAGGILALGYTWMAWAFVRTMIFLTQ
jgi:hypothetical protein